MDFDRCGCNTGNKFGASYVNILNLTMLSLFFFLNFEQAVVRTREQLG